MLPAAAIAAASGMLTHPPGSSTPSCGLARSSSLAGEPVLDGGGWAGAPAGALGPVVGVVPLGAGAVGPVVAGGGGACGLGAVGLVRVSGRWPGSTGGAGGRL